MAKRKRNKQSTPTPTVAPIQRRRYAGAAINRITSDWITSSTSADAEIYSSLKLLRDRSRELIRDNDYARSAVQTILTNVLGENGIRLQSKVTLQRGGKLANSTNTQIEDLWKLWGNAEYCDASNRHSWPEIERLALRSIIESGEVLIRLVPQAFRGSPVPFALQVLEPDYIADDYNSPLDVRTGNTVRMGIECDSWGAPVAYHLYAFHPGDNWRNVKSAGTQLQRIPADQIIHLYVAERPGQTRGVPWLTSALQRLQHIGQYEQAELVAARVHASQMGFIKSPYVPADTAQSDEPQQSQVEMSPGTIPYLAPGEDFVAFSPQHPNQALPEFLRYMLRGICAGTNVDYEALSHDYSQTSYSSQRASMLSQRDYYRTLQSWLSGKLHNLVYKKWLDAAVMANALSFPDYEANPQRYLSPTWIPRAFDWIDPSKDANASATALKTGLTTLSRELASQGLDFEEVLAERQREIELLKQAGISVEIYPETLQQPAAPQPDLQPQDNLTPVRSIEQDPIQLAVAIASALMSRSIEGATSRECGCNKSAEPVLALPAEPEPFEPEIEGFITIRPLENQRKAKNCLQKPCGNSCISKGKACLADLSPEQKALAKKAQAAMKSGKTPVSSELPLGQQPESSTLSPSDKEAKDKAQLDPILHDFYDFVKKGGKLTPEEELMAADGLGVKTLSYYQQKKVAKLQKDNLNPLEAAAFESYIGSGYDDMNAALYAPEIYQSGHGSKGWQAQMAINKAAAAGMKNIPVVTQQDINSLAQQHGIKYKEGDPMIRHVTLSGEVLQNFIGKHQKALDSGEPHLVEQFLSTTFKQDGLNAFKSGANVEIRVKAKLDGSGSGVLVDKYKNYNFESEVLYPPMTSFKVSKIEKKGGTKDKVKKETQTITTAKYKAHESAISTLEYASSLSHYTGTSLTGNLGKSEKQAISSLLPEGYKLADLNKKAKKNEILTHLKEAFAKEAAKTTTKEVDIIIPGKSAKYIIHYEEL